MLSGKCVCVCVFVCVGEDGRSQCSRGTDGRGEP